ncbi:Integrase core domain [Popillia japonica]|uniref:RNA-directed DNA polymerase n=1 Tax=Popillia japonica TaxID=7064 RepID=A0AAW1HWL6_POPJA
MLAVIFSVTKLRYFLLGKKFTIETDHIALTTMMEHKFTNGRLYRWSILLAEYDFEIKYRPGKHMIAADVISRKNEVRKHSNVLIAHIHHKQKGLFSRERLTISQNSPELKNIRKKLKENPYKEMFLEEDLIRKRIGKTLVYVVDEQYCREIIQLIHQDFNHIGSRKCWLIFREEFFCKNDERICKELVGICQVCQQAKHRNFTNSNVDRSIRVQDRMELLAIDFLSQLPRTTNGYRHLLVIYDVFAKYVRLIPTARSDTETTLNGLTQFFTEFGLPQKILSDNATYFNNDRYKNFLLDKHIKPIYTTIRNPRANPSERAIQEVLKYLRITLTEDHRKWVKHISEIERTINHTPNTELGTIPYTIMTGKPPERPWKTKREIKYAEEYTKLRERLQEKSRKWEMKQQDFRKKRKIYALNDLVWVKNLRTTDTSKHQSAKLTKP